MKSAKLRARYLPLSAPPPFHQSEAADNRQEKKKLGKYRTQGESKFKFAPPAETVVLPPPLPTEEGFQTLPPRPSLPQRLFSMLKFDALALRALLMVVQTVLSYRSVLVYCNYTVLGAIEGYTVVQC